MFKAILGFIATVLASSGCLAAELTATETRWLQGLWPVVVFAKEAGLALDIVVQPQPTPGVAPLALAFVGGRCKLVLSMRGNPEAQATLERIAPALLDPTLELMAAHELGHCKRYVDGDWHGLPSGFARGDPGPSGAAPRADDTQAAAERREEAYGDLVGLAWTQRQHRPQYAALHAWLLAERSMDLVPGSPHDTLAWVRLAGDGAALLQPSLFAGVAALWAAGLTLDD